MRLSQILFFALFCVAQSDCNAKCASECVRKQAAIEKTAHCRYVIRNFKPWTRTVCPVPETNYQDIYKNYSVTNHEQLYIEYQPCMDWFAGIIFDNLIYVFMIIYIILLIKYPWP